MKKNLLFMAGVTLILYSALNPARAWANQCDDDYNNCMIACQADPMCRSGQPCFGSYLCCTGDSACMDG